jgi:hypothetical protein
VPTVINGLPAHVLLIHVIVILVPLGALFTALSAVWPAARHKLGFISPLTCLIALIFVPITTHAGEWLKNYDLNVRQFSGDIAARIEKHANLAAGFVWYTVGLFAISTAVWLLGRKYEISLLPIKKTNEVASPNGSNGGGGIVTATRTRTQAQTETQTKALPQWASILLAVAAVAMSVLIVWQLYRIGDAGARAVWEGSVSGS